MTGLKLTNLYIRSFRGIKALDLNFNEGSLVLCGENGTGKSSIVSALEFLFTNNIRNLKGQWVNPGNKSVTHILDDKSELLIEAQFTDNQYLKKTFDDLEMSEDFDKYIEKSFFEASFFLNRKKLLGFVEASEGDRYKELANFFGLTKLDDIEDQFRKAKTTLSKEKGSKEKELGKILENLSSLYNKEFDDTEDIINEVNVLLKENSFEEIDINTDFDGYKSNFKDLLTHSRMNDLIENTNYKLENLEIPTEEYKTLIKKYNEYSLNTLQSSNNLLTILKESKKYFKNGEADTCPVCNNPIDNSILASLDENIGELTNEFDQFKDWNDDLKGFNDLLDDLKNSFDSINDNMRELNKLTSSLNMEETSLGSEFLRLKGDLSQLMEDLNGLGKFNISIADIDGEKLENISSEIDSMENEFNDFTQKLNIKKVDDDIGTISDSINLLASYKRINQEIDELETQVQTSEKTYKTFTDLKEKFVEKLVAEIEEDVIDYYTFIHKDDEIRNPKLFVSKSKGVKLKIDFYDQTGINPRSFSSEGHLDTLGICIFLAIAKRLSKTPIIVLDDVIATVDMGHKDRIAMLLFEKFGDYQMFITTHNKLWYEQLKRFENEYRENLSKPFVFAEIIDWSLMDGPIFTRFKSDKKIIYHHLDSEYLDFHAAANGARRYLEFILYRFCKAHSLELKFQDEYMLNDYLGPVEDEILSLTEGTILHDYYQGLFSDLRATKFSANKLSHYDEKNKLFTYNEVNGFVELVFRLEYSLFYLKGYKKLKFKKGTGEVIVDPKKDKRISMEDFLSNINDRCANEKNQRKR